MKPDYRLIHRLEYELGFRDDPPPPPEPSDAPGAVFTYKPIRRARETGDVAELSRLLKQQYCGDVVARKYKDPAS